jgi:hypothetical protein
LRWGAILPQCRWVNTGAATIGVTVVVVGAIAGGLGQAIKEPEPKPPEPRDAEFKLSLEGDARREHKLVAEGVSGLPPDRTVELVSEDGRKTATVNPLPETGCVGVSDRRNAGYTGRGETEWCLQFVDAPDYGGVTGLAEGRPEPNSSVGATNLALTLSTRDQFVGAPLLVVGAGIIISLLLALVGSVWLPMVAGNRLARLRARGKSIAGLAELSDQLRKKERSADEVARVLAPVVRKGPARAKAARSSLRKALAESSLPEKQRYGSAAATEANRSDNKIGDFLDADGNPVDHPAHRFEAGLAPMRAYYDQLTAAKKEIDEKLKPYCQSQPKVAFETAERGWSGVEDPDAIAGLRERFDKARTVLDEKLAPSGRCLKPGVRGASAQWEEKKTRIDVTLPVGELLGAVGRWGVFLGLGAASILAILVAVAAAGFGVWLATYEPVATFGETKDYAALFAAALATGAATNVAAILQPWRGGG